MTFSTAEAVALAALSEYAYSRNPLDQATDIAALGIAPPYQEISLGNGLFAQAFRIDGAVVIAFRGTDFNAGLPDWTEANIPLGLGVTSLELTGATASTR